MTQTTITVPRSYMVGSGEPTTLLRWSDGVLEQCWRAVEYDGDSHRPIAQHETWRPVPIHAETQKAAPTPEG